MSKKTYKQIIEMANKKPLTVKQFDDFFKPIENENEYGYLIDFSNEAEQAAKEFIKKNNLTTEVHQHIWTVVDGSSGKPCAINGWHMCNRIGYIICKTPWGDGTENDSNVYIEAKY
jgi:sulfur transfer protein SufE